MNTHTRISSKHMWRWESQSIAKRFYNASPWYIQNVMVSAYGLILMRRMTSPAVRQHLGHYLITQWYSSEEIKHLQTKKLSALIDHAYHNVPYYRQVFDNLHLKPEDIQEPADLQKLPLLSKQDVRQNSDKLLAQNIDPRKLNAMATSGTTGAPVTVFVTSNNAATERALNLRMRTWAGSQAGDKRATITGFWVVPQDVKELPLWRYDWPERRLHLSAYHITAKNIGKYVEKIRDFNPKIVEGYASYLYLMASYLERIGETLPVNAVFPSSETLFPYQRQLIEERFNCKAFDWYGLTERAASAAQCGHSDGYHVNAEKTIIEIVDPEGNTVSTGERGEIVGTNLEEFGMPLIRYRSGDMSAYRTENCPCGRSLPLIEQIQTRVDDIITTSDGRLINPAPLMGLFRSKAIERGRIIQENYDQYTILIVPNQGYSESEIDPIIKGAHNILGQQAQISVQLVDDIPCLPNGKYPFVISKIRVRV